MTILLMLMVKGNLYFAIHNIKNQKKRQPFDKTFLFIFNSIDFIYVLLFKMNIEKSQIMRKFAKISKIHGYIVHFFISDTINIAYNRLIYSLQSVYFD